jgi:hypothetical protein
VSRCAALLALGLLTPQAAQAWPVLARGKATAVGACYPDHRIAALWWLAPPAPVVKVVEGQPAVSFTQFRYSGTRATHDQGTFWGRSLLQFTLIFPESGPRLAQARTVLPPGARVEPIAPAVVEAQVVCAAADSPTAAVDAGTARSAAGAQTPVRATAWEERSFSLSIPPQTTRLHWEAFERGAIIVSVNVSAAAPALAVPPETGQEPPTPGPLPLMVHSVAVTIDPRRNPGALKTLELDATMAAGYTFLDVAFADFTEGTAFRDLAVVLVTVSAKAVNGDTLRQEVRFDSSTPAQQGVQFDRAVRLDAGYDVVVHRVFATGRAEVEPSRHVEAWTGFFNASSTGSPEPSGLDPRLLY